MDGALAATLALFGGLAGVAVFSGWRGARPWVPSRGPRLLPWRLLMLTFGFCAILALVHAAHLAGLVRDASSR